MRPPAPRPTPWLRRAVWLLVLLGLALTGQGLLGAAARAQSTGSSEVVWRWPIEPAIVLRTFSADQQPYGPGHDGADLAADAGDPIRSAGDGVVSFAGVVAGRPVVVVQHPDGLRTTYEPVAPSVSRGQPVAAGEVLGQLAGQPWHCGWRACLHWGLRRGDTYLDPLVLVHAGPPRLLPLWSALWSALPSPPARPVPSASVAPSRSAGTVPRTRAGASAPGPPWASAPGLALAGWGGWWAWRRWRR